MWHPKASRPIERQPIWSRTQPFKSKQASHESAGDRALRSTRTKDHGRCRPSRKSIPDEQLKVQPDTLVGMPCLARADRNPVEE